MLLVKMISFQTLIWAATRTRRQELEGTETYGGGRTPCATEAAHQGAACGFTPSNHVLLKGRVNQLKAN